MVGFDGCAFTETTFNDIGIDRSLYQEIYSTDFLCFIFKDTDKFFTDNLSLCFRFGYAGEFCIETILCVYTDEIQVVWSFRPEYGFYFVAFIFTQKAMVYEYAVELLSDCF